VEIKKKQKSKSVVLMFAGLSAENGSADDYREIKKKKPRANKMSKLLIY
jgi:hypothetical protein